MINLWHVNRRGRRLFVTLATAILERDLAIGGVSVHLSVCLSVTRYNNMSVIIMSHGQWRRSAMKLGGPGHVSLLILFFPFSFFPSRGPPLPLIQHYKLSSGSGQSQAVEHILMHFTFKKHSKVYTMYVYDTHWGVESSDFRRQRKEG